MKKYTIWCLLIGLITIITGNNAHATAKPKTASVTIIVNDVVYRQGLTVSFKICQNGINTNRSGYIKYYTFKLNARKTKCQVPLSTALNYGRIDLYNPSPSFKDWDMALDNDNNLFIFENGDDVTITLGMHKNQAIFSGKSKVKFNCLYSLSNIPSYRKSDIWNKYYAKNEPYKGYQDVKKYCDSLTEAKTLKLESASFNPKVKELIKLDIWAEGNLMTLSYPYTAYSLRNSKREWIPESKKFLLTYFGDNYKLPEVDEKLLAGSYKLGDFLAVREKMIAVVTNSTDTSSYYHEVKFKHIWNTINRHYKPGLIKDKVTLMSFVAILRDREDDFINYTALAYEQAKSSQIKTALKKIDAVNKKGKPAFQFSLSDEKGKIVTLNDFKGKVVVLDFWFTGCSGCLNLAKVMNPLVEEYKPNPNIVFVSISVDRSRSAWLQSLKEGKYTSGDEINLLAENGWQSEIVQYYNIDGFPTLLVISKEGKIISTTPPNPKYYLKEFKVLLEHNF